MEDQVHGRSGSWKIRLMENQIYGRSQSRNVLAIDSKRPELTSGSLTCVKGEFYTEYYLDLTSVRQAI